MEECQVSTELECSLPASTSMFSQTCFILPVLPSDFFQDIPVTDLDTVNL
jgi:hypothetical protein